MRILARRRHMWEENIRIELKEIDVNTRNWVDSPKGTDYWRGFGNAPLKLRVHKPWIWSIILQSIVRILDSLEFTSIRYAVS